MITGRHNRLVRLEPRSTTAYVSQNRTVLATGLDGFVCPRPDQGLIVHQTRMINKYKYLLNGSDFVPVAMSNVDQHSWMGYYIQAAPGYHVKDYDRGSGEMSIMSEKTIELRVTRFVGLGVHEDLYLTNYSQKQANFELQMEIDGDFADQQEVNRERKQQGKLTREWRRADDGRWELLLDYAAENHYSHQGNVGFATIHRALAYRVQKSPTQPQYKDGRVCLQVSLAPLEEWHACIEFVPFIEGEAMPPFYDCKALNERSSVFDIMSDAYLSNATYFTTVRSEDLSQLVADTLEQAKSDLAALRLFDFDHGYNSWTVAAGLPIYIALFGRDTLTASWQAAISSDQMLRGTLQELPRWQGTVVNDWRDEEPGRMLHEAHTGPLAALRYNPRSRYYGSATTSKFYPIVLAELWHWTGDKEAVAPLIDPALRGLEWCDQYGDIEHDGFYSYLTHSSQGTKNQGWKDSGDAIVDADGEQVEPPISTVEEQGFAYAAKLHLSEVLWWLDRREEAKRLFHQALELKKRFNEVFWMPDEQYFAMGLGPERKQIRSITCDPGHCLTTGIIDSSLAEHVMRRMMQPDLFTGWGLRTLSSKHPAFDPFSYHRGSVWPVEHGSFVMGFMRYGYHDAVNTLARGIFDAAQMFAFHRLPEVFSGHQRDEAHPFPALYPKTCWPQAWSASSVFALMQAMLGLYPYAPLNLLIVDPHLPVWLPEITVTNLHVGKAVVAIRFYREASGRSSYEVLDKRGRLYVARQANPWSQTDGAAERIVDLLTSLLPGKH